MATGDGGRRRSLDISMDEDGSSFEVQRRSATVYVRDLDVPSSFPNSRDWFELFQGDAYTPPKFFHLVLQWIVCSSVHLVHFMTRLVGLAESHGYSLVPLPVAQLFPQPAPHWVWGGDRETNFDRLALYPRRRMALPAGLDAATRGRLNARLLERWLRSPLGFLFVFESPVSDFRAMATQSAEGIQREMQHRLQAVAKRPGVPIGCTSARRAGCWPRLTACASSRCERSTSTGTTTRSCPRAPPAPPAPRHRARRRASSRIELWRAFQRATADVLAEFGGGPAPRELPADVAAEPA
ncbi:unnamed protein product, partial [Prorocentrum cordatum]